MPSRTRLLPCVNLAVVLGLVCVTTQQPSMARSFIDEDDLVAAPHQTDPTLDMSASFTSGALKRKTSPQDAAAAEAAAAQALDQAALEDNHLGAQTQDPALDSPAEQDANLEVPDSVLDAKALDAAALEGNGHFGKSTLDNAPIGDAEGSALDQSTGTAGTSMGAGLAESLDQETTPAHTHPWSDPTTSSIDPAQSSSPQSHPDSLGTNAPTLGEKVPDSLSHKDKQVPFGANLSLQYMRPSNLSGYGNNNVEQDPNTEQDGSIKDPITRLEEQSEFDEPESKIHTLEKDAFLFIPNHDISTAVLIDLAQQGDLDSQLQLAFMYATGDEVEQDYHEAQRWFLRAAEQNSVDAQFYLGVIYQEGIGVEQDFNEAYKWFAQAAAQKDPNAQYSLALLYYEGKGVAQSLEQAFNYFSLAAAQDNSDAQLRLGEMYEKGEVVSSDLKQALFWYEKACNLGDKVACAKASQIVKQLQASATPVDASMEHHEPSPETEDVGVDGAAGMVDSTMGDGTLGDGSLGEDAAAADAAADSPVDTTVGTSPENEAPLSPPAVDPNEFDGSEIGGEFEGAGEGDGSSAAPSEPEADSKLESSEAVSTAEFELEHQIDESADNPGDAPSGAEFDSDLESAPAPDSLDTAEGIPAP